MADTHKPGKPSDEQSGEADAAATEADERKSPSGKVVYKTILAEADEELSRPTYSLFWSGVAAGLSMGFSGIGVALLKAFLPHASWTPLVSKLGYSLGFLLVILGRQQLFTENTLTPVLPFLRGKPNARFSNVARLWSTIFIANILGAVAVACVLAQTNALEHDVHTALIDIAREAMQGSFGSKILRGIFAGWLIAMIVWLLPFAESARIWIIIILTYVVSLGHFPHVIAGAVEVFVLAWSSDITWAQALGGFILPTLIGNIIGGVTLVAAINHAQVVEGET